MAKDGPFMAMSDRGRATMGAPMGSSDNTTVQLAVPPRISAP